MITQFLQLWRQNQILKRREQVTKAYIATEAIEREALIAEIPIHLFFDYNVQLFDYKVQLCNIRGASMSGSKSVTLVNTID